MTHLVELRGSELERQVIGSMLRAEYFQSDQDRPLDFLLRQTGAVFRFLCGSSARSLAASVLAAFGLLYFSMKRRASALLLVFPFLLSWAAALLDLYPYGGVRQSVYLLPFAAAAIGAGLSAAVAQRLSVKLALIPAFAAAALVAGPPALPRNISVMDTVIGRLQASAPPGGLVFVDGRAGCVLDYYLGRDAPSTERPGRERFWESSAGGYRIIASPVWNFTPNSFSTELERLLEVYELRGRQVLWVMNVETETDFAAEESRRFPGSSIPLTVRSGEISLFEAVLP